MGFLRRVRGVTIFNKVCSYENRRAAIVKPLLRIERPQLHCFSHVTRMLRKRWEVQVVAAPTRQRPTGRPRTTWRNYISDLLV